MKRIAFDSPIVIGLIIIVLALAGFSIFHAVKASKAEQEKKAAAQMAATAEPEAPAAPKITHMATPPVVKALYMSSWIASSVKSRAHIVSMLEATEANAVVLDIKDETGHPSFAITDPVVTATKSPENRIRDIEDFIRDLHAKNIYVIGRIVVFKDQYLTKQYPQWTLSKKSDGTPWKDPHGAMYLNPGNKNVWDYTTGLAKDAYAVGFDEINFDYVRYPSDGKLSDLNYGFAQGMTRASTVESFFKYLNENIKKDQNIPISADVFGQTTTENSDMGIGQIFEHDVQYFDFIAPMIYPSHYGPNNYGLKVPAEHPYETIVAALRGAKNKIDKVQADPNISAEVKANTDYKKVRPWLQDFSINRVKYTPEMVRAQIKATYDSGLPSWMMWDPSNKYTQSAYLPKNSAPDAIAPIPAAPAPAAAAAGTAPQAQVPSTR